MNNLTMVGSMLAGVLTVGVIVSVSACAPPPAKDLEVPSEPVSSQAGYKPTPGLVVNIYIDGSGSIEHFLHNPDKRAQAEEQPVSGTNYLQTLLERIESQEGSSEWGKDKVHFWRFGEDCPIPLPAGEAATMGNDPAGRFQEKDTKLRIPFSADPTALCPQKLRPQHKLDNSPELKILISDLYESDPNKQILNALGEQIGERYLRSDATAVAVLAIRNPYYGKVEDLPVKPEATSMPFYVILSGPATDVQYGVRFLLDRTKLVDAFSTGKAQLVYFSKSESGYTGSALGDGDVKGDRDRPHIFDSNYRGSTIAFYKLDKGKLTAKWTEPPTDAWASTTGWKPAWSIAAGARGGDSISAVVYGNQNGAHNPPKDDKAAAISAVSCSQGVETCIAIDRTALLPGRNYRFRVDVKESASSNLEDTDDAAPLHIWSIAMPKAMNPASYPDGHFRKIAGIEDSSPGLTPDLTEFLRVLQTEVFNDKEQRIMNHHYIFVHAD